MTSFETRFRYSPYLFDTSAEPRVFVGTVGYVITYRLPMPDQNGVAPELEHDEDVAGRGRERELVFPHAPGCEPRRSPFSQT